MPIFQRGTGTLVILSKVVSISASLTCMQGWQIIQAETSWINHPHVPQFGRQNPACIWMGFLSFEYTYDYHELVTSKIIVTETVAISTTFHSYVQRSACKRLRISFPSFSALFSNKYFSLLGEHKTSPYIHYLTL